MTKNIIKIMTAAAVAAVSALACGYQAAGKRRAAQPFGTAEAVRLYDDVLTGREFEWLAWADTVNAHKNDFDCYSYDTFMEQAGGYEKYMESLGGVFEKYGTGNYEPGVLTADEVRSAAQYVWGVISIWGFDYVANGYDHCTKWGAGKGGFGGTPLADAFYPEGTLPPGEEKAEQDGRSSLRDIADGAEGTKGRTTHCGFAPFEVLKILGILDVSDRGYYDFAYYGEKAVKIITDASELQPGDIIFNFKQENVPEEVKRNPGSVWWDYSYSHVDFVGETDREAGTFTLYESGHWLTDWKGGKLLGTPDPRLVRDASAYKGSSGGSPFGGECKDWVGFRFAELAEMP